MARQRKKVRAVPTNVIAADLKAQERGAREGDVSIYTCPDCGGALWQLEDGGGVLKFACHTGHSYTADVLVVEKSHTLRQSVSEAVRIFKEKAILLRQLALKVNARNAVDLIEQADQDDEHARFLQSHFLQDAPDHPSIDTTADVLADIVRGMKRPADD